MGTRWLGGRSLHTTRSIAQTFVGVVFGDVSSHLYDFCCVQNSLSGSYLQVRSGGKIQHANAMWASIGSTTKFDESRHFMIF